MENIACIAAIGIGLSLTFQVVGGALGDRFTEINTEIVQYYGDQERSNQDAEHATAVLAEVPASNRKLSRDAFDLIANSKTALAFIALFALSSGLFCLRKRNDEVAEEKTSQITEPLATRRSPALANVLAKRNVILSRLKGNWQAMLTGQAIVETYMSHDVIAIQPDTDKRSALATLEKQGFRRCMVTGPDGVLAGVVSKKDIIAKSGTLVRDLMTGRPRVASPKMEIHVALSILLENRISCLPVVDKGLLIGVVSTSDLLMVLQCLLVEINAQQKANTTNLQCEPN